MTIVRIGLIVVAALAVLALLRSLTVVADARIPHRRRRGHDQGGAAPAGMLAIERTLWMSTANAQDQHHRLLPLARQIARHRLATHHGIDLDREPAAAEAVLGRDVYLLVAPDRQEPADRFARGLDPRELAALVDALDRLAAV